MTSPLTWIETFSIPTSWRFPLITVGAMIALAGLDFAAAIFAKEWSERGHVILVAGGMISFGVLFYVYARILAIAELSVVTLGWIVVLQLMIVLVDRWIYGVTLPWPKWAAIFVILILQIYLVLGPSGTPHRASAVTPAESSSVVSQHEKDGV